MDIYACGILRANDISIAIVCSAAEFVLPSGAFTTTIPFSVAASRSILSTPTPARPITFKLCPFSITSRVTCVWLLTNKPSYSPILFTNSAADKPVSTTTSIFPASRKGKIPSSFKGSLINILNTILVLLRAQNLILFARLVFQDILFGQLQLLGLIQYLPQVDLNQFLKCLLFVEHLQQNNIPYDQSG